MSSPYSGVYFAMATVLSWMFNLLIQLLTIFRPPTRRLWCAVPGNLSQPFSIECVADEDDIHTLKKKIWDHAPPYAKKDAAHFGDTILYCPVVELNHEEEFDVCNGERLSPRQMITSNPPICHSFPYVMKPESGMPKISNKITEDRSIPFDINDSSIKSCYQKGWIHRVALDDADDIAILPSRLHEKYFSHVPISLLLFSSDCFRYIEYLIGRAAKPLPTRFGLWPAAKFIQRGSE